MEQIVEISALSASQLRNRPQLSSNWRQLRSAIHPRSGGEVTDCHCNWDNCSLGNCPIASPRTLAGQLFGIVAPALRDDGRQEQIVTCPSAQLHVLGMLKADSSIARFSGTVVRERRQ